MNVIDQASPHCKACHNTKQRIAFLVKEVEEKNKIINKLLYIMQLHNENQRPFLFPPGSES